VGAAEMKAGQEQEQEDETYGGTMVPVRREESWYFVGSGW